MAETIDTFVGMCLSAFDAAATEDTFAAALPACTDMEVDGEQHAADMPLASATAKLAAQELLTGDEVKALALAHMDGDNADIDDDLLRRLPNVRPLGGSEHHKHVARETAVLLRKISASHGIGMGDLLLPFSLGGYVRCCAVDVDTGLRCDSARRPGSRTCTRHKGAPLADVWEFCDDD